MKKMMMMTFGRLVDRSEWNIINYVRQPNIIIIIIIIISYTAYYKP